jgi:hypothetical protein
LPKGHLKATSISLDVIFRVGPQRGGDTRPSQTLDAILGIGWNGTFPSQGGTGVTGIGGPNQGTGVVGRGPGDNAGGNGGDGVHGTGGGVSGPQLGPTDPGTGVVGRGGLYDQIDLTQRLHGTGVVGVAGDAPVPSYKDTGSVGVFGSGGNADRKTMTIPGEGTGLVGPQTPGSGVLGKGGIQIIDGVVGSPGAGVIGLAGGLSMPTFGQTADTGVYGEGAVGVRGNGRDNIGGVFFSKDVGVLGFSLGADRGGAFESNSAAQIRLVLGNSGEKLPRAEPYSVFALSFKVLPKNGQTGDLFCTVMSDSDSIPNGVLWFCVKGGDGFGDLPWWSQVLLGPVFFVRG